MLFGPGDCGASRLEEPQSTLQTWGTQIRSIRGLYCPPSKHPGPYHLVIQILYQLGIISVVCPLEQEMISLELFSSARRTTNQGIVVRPVVAVLSFGYIRSSKTCRESPDNTSRRTAQHRLPLCLIYRRSHLRTGGES